MVGNEDSWVEACVNGDDGSIRDKEACFFFFSGKCFDSIAIVFFFFSEIVLRVTAGQRWVNIWLTD